MAKLSTDAIQEVNCPIFGGYLEQETSWYTVSKYLVVV